jgi:hypothetical protein
MGDWRAVDENHVRRSHVGWLFSNGNPAGYFTQTETDEVARDGSWYRGNNYIRLYDLNGVQFAEGAGTAEATRIPAPAEGPAPPWAEALAPSAGAPVPIRRHPP